MFESNDADDDIFYPFCSQSSISAADCMSEISIQLDLFREGGFPPNITMTGNESRGGKSSPIGQATSVSGGGNAENFMHPPFTLSPLNENDEYYDNPLD